ncbi:MAG: hypothetical protein WKG01_31800 [Kofleriaceae bacterium]
MKTAFVLAGLVLVAVACGKEINPNYCLANPEDVDCPAIDAGTACTSSAECMGATPVCDTTGSMTCVQCLPDQARACTGVTPTCGDDERCRGCGAHAECAVSNACSPDGACADEGDVAYVGGPGATDNEMCTKAAPCTKVMKALARGRAYVMLAGTIDEGATVVIDSENVTLLAQPGAKLVRTTGVILEVKGSSQVAVYDVEINGGGGRR